MITADQFETYREQLYEYQHTPVQDFCDTNLTNVTHRIGLFGEYEGTEVGLHKIYIVTPNGNKVDEWVTLDTERAMLKLGDYAEIHFSYEKSQDVESFWKDNYNSM